MESESEKRDSTHLWSSPPVLAQKGWYCFVTNKTIKIFLSENKFIETSNIQIPIEYSSQTPLIFNWFTDIFRVKIA